METILMPTDFSPAADNAVNYAVELANFFDAQLVLLHVYSLPSTGADAGFSLNLYNAWRNESVNKLEEMKKNILQKNKKNLMIECVAEVGDVYAMINSVSQKYNADLIVMGIIGEAGKIKEHLIGSTAVKVARYINIPSFIIPQYAKYHPIRSISFACDMEKTEQTALISMAKCFSRMFDAELEIVNVENPKEEFSYEKARTSVFIESKLESIRHKIVYITDNKVARTLEDYFENHPTNVIMLNPKKHNIFFRLFKESVTNELAFHVNIPILAIH